jgi:hypothetical protein
MYVYIYVYTYIGGSVGGRVRVDGLDVCGVVESVLRFVDGQALSSSAVVVSSSVALVKGFRV